MAQERDEALATAQQTQAEAAQWRADKERIMREAQQAQHAKQQAETAQQALQETQQAQQAERKEWEQRQQAQQAHLEEVQQELAAAVEERRKLEVRVVTTLI